MTMICPKSWFHILKHTTLGGEREAMGHFSGHRVEPTFPIEHTQEHRYNPQTKISYLRSIAMNTHTFYIKFLKFCYSFLRFHCVLFHIPCLFVVILSFYGKVTLPPIRNATKLLAARNACKDVYSKGA